MSCSTTRGQEIDEANRKYLERRNRFRRGEDLPKGEKIEELQSELKAKEKELKDLGSQLDALEEEDDEPEENAVYGATSRKGVLALIEDEDEASDTPAGSMERRGVLNEMDTAEKVDGAGKLGVLSEIKKRL